MLHLITDTRTKNLLLKAGITDPQHVTLHDLARIPGIGPNHLRHIAEAVYRYRLRQNK